MHVLRAAHRGGEDRATCGSRRRQFRTRFHIHEFKTACQQACPTDAIIFGNIKDPESACLATQGKRARTYVSLKYSNTAPAGKLSGPHQESEPENARCGQGGQPPTDYRMVRDAPEGGAGSWHRRASGEARGGASLMDHVITHYPTMPRDQHRAGFQTRPPDGRASSRWCSTDRYDRMDRAIMSAPSSKRRRPLWWWCLLPVITAFGTASFRLHHLSDLDRRRCLGETTFRSGGRGTSRTSCSGSVSATPAR